MPPDPQMTEHVRRLANVHLVLDPQAPPLLHWTHDTRHYPGYECLSMMERSFGRALRLWESLTRLNNEPLKVGLIERLQGNVWDCSTPNRDESESLHVIYSYSDRPWVVNKLEDLGAGQLKEGPSPFSVWADLDARPRWEADGKPANLVAWNADRLKSDLPPYTADLPACDKHAILLQLMWGIQFTCFRRGPLEIHPSALREMVYGYQAESSDWIPQSEWDRRGTPNTQGSVLVDPLGDDEPAPAEPPGSLFVD